jgi:hypothetical protein
MLMYIFLSLFFGVADLLIEFSLGWKISMEYLVFLGFIDGATSHTLNMASTTWVIYSPEGQLVSSGGIFMEPSTNNVVDYSVVIELMCDTISHGV